MSLISRRKKASFSIASRATCRPLPSAGRIPPPPNAASESTPTSRRWRRPWMRCARSPAARMSTSGDRARAASPCRHAHLAARGERKIHSATVAVCLLDMAATQNTTAGLFVTPESIIAAKSASQLAGVVEGRELARMFAWMRPNDLIWNYWVNNYLLGNAPPAFDVLYWNNDTTRLPAQLHADFLDLVDTNPFVNPGRLKVCGTR